MVTDNTKTLANALARIESLETENAHLLKVIKERKVAGYLCSGRLYHPEDVPFVMPQYKPVYYISYEYDAAGFLITPEVKIEQ